MHMSGVNYVKSAEYHYSCHIYCRDGLTSGKRTHSRMDLSAKNANTLSDKPKPVVGGRPCSSASTKSWSGICASVSPAARRRAKGKTLRLVDGVVQFRITV